MRIFPKTLLTLGLLLLALCPAAFAADLQLQADGSESAVLSLVDLGGASVNSVQLSLELTGSYPSASFEVAEEDSADGKYGTMKSAEANGKTTFTIYVDSPKSFNKNGTAVLGTLNLGGSYTAPTSARLRILGHDLGPDASGGDTSETTIKVQLASGGSSSGSSSKTIRVTEADHGMVILSSSKARPGTTITIKVEPDAGYRLSTLTVLSGGKEIALQDKGDGSYTFTMPNGAVEIKAVFAEAGSALPFADVGEGMWYYDAVQYAYEKGLMNGTSATTFSPNNSLSRGMVITILYRMAGSPAVGAPSFTDVPADQYYASPVAWAAANGVVSGYGNNRFGPNDPVTREQMAVILQGYAKLNGKDVSKRADLSAFADAGQISDYAVEAIRWANAEGLINGTSPTTLTPRGTATRAQAATLFRNFCENILQ